MKIGEEIINQYLDALREKIVCEETDHGAIISLPFYITGGHSVEVTVREKQHGYLLFTDESQTIGDLFLSGLATGGRTGAIIRKVVGEHEIQIDEETSEIKAVGQMSQAGDILHNMILAAVKIGGLEILKRANLYPVPKIVRQVRRILKEEKVQYHSNYMVPGKESPKIRVDIFSQNGVDRVIQTMDRERDFGTYIDAWAFRLHDMKMANKKLHILAVYNPDNADWYPLSHLIEGRADKVAPAQDDQLRRAILDPNY